MAEGDKDEMYFTMLEVVKEINEKLLLRKNNSTLAFQFISLDKLAGDKLIRWTISKDYQILSSYQKAATEFTGEENPVEQNVARTLVDKDWDSSPYSYAFNDTLGSNHENDDLSNLEYIAYHKDDKIELIQLPTLQEANSVCTGVLIDNWFSCLKKNFDGGSSYLWVPQPHIRKLTDQKIFNSAFLVFSKPITEELKYPIAKLIRDFIVQHVVDLVYYKLKTNMQSSSHFYPTFNGLDRKGDSKKKELVEILKSRYFSNNAFLQDFIKESLDAISFVSRLKARKFQCDPSEGRKFTHLRDITSNKEKELSQLLFGRFCVLALHILFQRPLSEIYYCLTGTYTEYPEKSLRDIFGIKGLKKDMNDKVMTNLFDVVPNASKAEREFLLNLCDLHRLPEMREKITQTFEQR